MKQRLTARQHWHLFFLLFKLGCFTFGGGFSLLSQIQTELVEKRELLTKEELMDISSAARSLPGVMIANITVLLGYHLGGAVCAVVSVIAISLPSILIMTMLTFVYKQFQDNVYVAKALAGIRCAVIPIIGSAALSLRESALVSRWSYLIFGIAVLLCFLTKISLFLIIIICGILGIITSYLPQGRRKS